MSIGDNLVEGKASPEQTHGRDVADLLLQDSHPDKIMRLAQNEKSAADISVLSPAAGYTVPVQGELPTVQITGTGMATAIVSALKALETQRK